MASHSSNSRYSTIGHALKEMKKVPLVEYKPQQPFNRRRVFKFDVNGAPGIRLSDAKEQNYDGLWRKDEELFKTDLFGNSEKVSIRVGWPGYRPFTEEIRSKNSTKERKPHSVAKSAHEIAKSIQKMTDDFSTRQCDKEHAEWAVGPGCIELRHLYLAEIWQVSKNSFEPVIYYYKCDV
ncbi:hypothetical protein WOLCODRAFT_17830 [Wolfiporia cocos MD-104 SS10]|uniref:Uncharacterized protein n=1 Tax=Wolfiporia cocos (strain MD-104) TaxID=742152 RepID=A0A2H3JK71_WOLCO|nr:hypothetical protein WOLCODRAFT_17830 [Wolfiporia cocos MD-104 SS10]